ncbi:MAG: hypothetical protein ACD_2C00037G0003 [uncultured bacterium (gcode 4)]|uniref:RDD domain-containing protein n=1 Tax=uncultured bacterium (gcode 4) TaxID=1234023 RepID=K2GI92_9BACT|nr:MAG: hypothetical protein ACD_2C00037G0003 [uncultured bacterium (gcode 4)]
MDQEKISKIAIWIKNNSNYPLEQIRRAAIDWWTTEEEFNQALDIARPKKQLEYKWVGIRFFAFIIDVIILGILLSIFKNIFWWTYPGGCDSSFSIGSTVAFNWVETFYGLCWFSAQLFFIAMMCYYVLSEWKLGGTLGKLMFWMRVVKTNGEYLDLNSSLIRNVMRIIDFIPFFYLVAAISIWNSKTKQRLWDRLAKSVVVSNFSLK